MQYYHNNNILVYRLKESHPIYTVSHFVIYMTQWNKWMQSNVHACRVFVAWLSHIETQYPWCCTLSLRRVPLSSWQHSAPCVMWFATFALRWTGCVAWVMTSTTGHGHRYLLVTAMVDILNKILSIYGLYISYTVVHQLTNLICFGR